MYKQQINVDLLTRKTNKNTKIPDDLDLNLRLSKSKYVQIDIGNFSVHPNPLHKRRQCKKDHFPTTEQ